MNGEIYLSLFFHIKGFTFPYKEWKLHQKSFEYMFIYKKTNGKKIDFTTTIKPNELPQANIYFFQIDVIANGLGEQDWWQNWNCRGV